MKDKIIIKDNEIVSNLDERTRALLEKAIKKATDFFEGRKTDFSIVLLDSREEMNKIHGSKTEDWAAGGVYWDNTVYLFDEPIFNLVSNHKKEEFSQILIHEITHIFAQKFFNLHYPMWLSEGLSFVVAGQDLNFSNKIIDKKELLNAYTESQWNVAHPYKSSALFVRFLFEKYGKKKMFELMGSLEMLEKESSFKRKFKNIIGQEFSNVLDELSLMK